MKLWKNREKPERDPLKRPPPTISPLYTPATADQIMNLRTTASRAWNFARGASAAGIQRINGFKLDFMPDSDTAILDMSQSVAQGERFLISRNLGNWAITHQVYITSAEKPYGTVTVRSQYFPVSGDEATSIAWDTARRRGDGGLDMQDSLSTELGVPIGTITARELLRSLETVVSDRQSAA